MDNEQPKSKKSKKSSEPSEKNIFVKSEPKSSTSKNATATDKIVRNLNEEMLGTLKTLVTLGVAITALLIVGLFSIWLNMANNHNESRHDRMMQNMMNEMYLQNQLQDPSMSCGLMDDGCYTYNDDAIYDDGGFISQDDGIYSDGDFITNDNNLIPMDPGQMFECRPMGNFRNSKLCEADLIERENLGYGIGQVDGATVTTRINR